LLIKSAIVINSTAGFDKWQAVRISAQPGDVWGFFDEPVFLGGDTEVDTLGEGIELVSIHAPRFREAMLGEDWS